LDKTTSSITNIQKLRIYGFNNYRHESFAELADLISWQIEDLPDNSTSRDRLLIKELSYLSTYCCLLLAQKPSTVEFTYNLVPEGTHNLWELPI
jgi:hypothetical protein